jgi:hypothetical protein
MRPDPGINSKITNLEDGSMRLTINVTDEDIKNGRVMQCGDCPVALAADRAARAAGLGLHPRCPVAVTRSTITFWSPKSDEFLAVLPENASAFVRNFDSPPHSRETPQPFTFKIDIPESARSWN